LFTELELLSDSANNELKRFILFITSAAMKKIITVICDWLICHLLKRNRAALPLHPEKIAVILCHWLGDTFWGMQVLPALRRKYPDADFHIFLRRNFSDLFYGQINPDCIHIAPAVVSDRKREKFSIAALLSTAGKYRHINFDIALDLTGNRYSALFASRLKAKCTIGFEGDELGMLYDIRANPEIYLGKPLRLRPLLVCSFLFPEIKFDCLMSPPVLKYRFQDVLDTAGLKQGLKLAIIAPCAGWAEKEWGDDHFAELAKKLIQREMQVIISGNGTEIVRCRNIAKKSGSIAWSGDLGGLITLFSGADIFVGNDSGTGHIAATFPNCHVFTIFTGATAPELLAPVGKNVTIIESAKLNQERVTALIAGVQD
jgi:heptosyltransferase I